MLNKKLFKVNPHIKWRWETNDKILLSSFLILNKTAGEILDLCNELCKNNEFCDVDAATELIHERYQNVPKLELREDVEKIMEDFYEKDIFLRYNNGRWERKFEMDEHSSKDFLHFARFPFRNEVISKFKRKLKAPIVVVCELTYNCNARCPHCYVSASRNRNRETELTTVEWKSVIDEARKMGVFTVGFSGGEPLLRNDLENLIKFAKSREMIVYVWSNGLLLTKEKIKKLEDAGLDYIQLPIDGLRETHDRFRGVNGLFDHVMDTINLLKKSKISTHVIITLNKINMEEVPRLMKLLNKMGVVYGLNDFHVVGRGERNKHLQLTEEDYLKVLLKIQEKEEEWNMKLAYPRVPASFFKKIIEIKYLNHIEPYKCFAGILTCAITPSGDVKPCTLSYGVTAGSVKEKTLEEIWKSSKLLNAFREADNDFEGCTFCPLREKCSSGCKALPHQINEDSTINCSGPKWRSCYECMREAKSGV